MGSQTSAILKGFDYQHLISWYHILSLKKGNAIKVILEDSQAGHVDDFVVYQKDGTVDFYQVKYHVSAGNYSIDKMLESTEGKSLLEKFWVTWKKLVTTYQKDKIRLILYSNWVQHPDDEILKCINGEDGNLNNSFFTASHKSNCGIKREEWKCKHSATDDEFNDFAKAISFHFGKDFTKELKGFIAERMELLHLKHADSDLHVASGIIRDWIKEKREEITIDILEERIAYHDLYLPINTEKSATVYFTTIKNSKFDLTPDYIVDWRKYFKQISDRGDHELINNEDWNKTLLPELRDLEKRLNSDLPRSLIRARGYSRLSPWIAFGYTFSEVAGYKIEVEQQSNIWRTDIKANPAFQMVRQNGDGDMFSGNTKTVAVGISLTGSLIDDVKRYILEKPSPVDSLLFIQPSDGPSKESLKSNEDLISFVLQAKGMIRDFVKKNRADKLLLFYFGPLSGACFLGHSLNAVCKEIQVMENTLDGSYTPSFLLT